MPSATAQATDGELRERIAPESRMVTPLLKKVKAGLRREHPTSAPIAALIPWPCGSTGRSAPAQCQFGWRRWLPRPAACCESAVAAAAPAIASCSPRRQASHAEADPKTLAGPFAALLNLTESHYLARVLPRRASVPANGRGAMQWHRGALVGLSRGSASLPCGLRWQRLFEHVDDVAGGQQCEARIVSSAVLGDGSSPARKGKFRPLV